MRAGLTDDEIRRIGERFADRSLPKPQWTHAAHFAAALWLLGERPELDAFAAMPGMIRAYNAATGTPNTDSEGYHETITLASLRAARAALTDAGPEAGLARVLGGLLAGPLGRSDWPFAYWTREVLFSVAARRAWVEPDLAPLPWP